MAQFRPKSSSLKAPSFGGKDTGLGTLLAYMIAQQNGQKIGQNIQSAEDQLGDAPPGTTVMAGPKGTSVKKPINQKLTGDEINNIAAKKVFNPLAEGLKQDTKNHVFDSKFGNIGRTYRQYAVGQPNALLTSYDPVLQATQGKINSIRRYVFGEGGKQLTPYEANIVNALIKPTGKSDEQYETDLDEALKLINSKAELVTGGMNAAKSPIPGMSGYQPPQGNQNSSSDDEEAIFNAWKQGNV